MYRVIQSCSSGLANVQSIVFDPKFIKIGRIRKCPINRSLCSTRRINNGLLVYSEEVEDALNRDIPVVALESTIITHGMPYPDNLTTALRVEEIIREKGVVPATIAIYDGKVQIGMDRDLLDKIAKCARKKTSSERNEEKNAEGRVERAVKCSRRDLSTVVWQKSTGGTTVGGTMTLARIAGIPIMATGGIGGVHRGAETSLDVSSDLTELGRNRTAVVCAGVKAILDIPKTLEYLETQGVPVITIGETDNFPAFYCRETSSDDPVKSPSRITNAEEAARIIRIQETLKLDTGILFAVPIPKSHALDSKIVETTIKKALARAESEGIRGKDVTPFLLKQLNLLTSGGFLKANQALVENNARVAADIALELSILRKRDKGSSISTSGVQQPSFFQAPAVVIGGATVDTMLHVELPSISLDGRTHRAKSRESHGGVGRNVACAMVALGLDNTRLVSAVGEDSGGRSIVEKLGDAAAETIDLLSNAVTPRYTAILDDKGECRFGIGEMDTFESIDVNLVRKYRTTIEKAGIIVLDGNLPLETMRESLDIAARNNIPVWYEPTDVAKARKIFEAGSEWIKRTGNTENSVVRFISPNVNELIAIAKHLEIPLEDNDIDIGDLSSKKDHLSVEWISELSKRLVEIVPIVITTLGSRGLVVARRGTILDPFFVPNRKSGQSGKNRDKKIESRWYPARIVEKSCSCEKFSASGCGDCLAGAIITGSYRGLNEVDCVKFALEAAAISFRSHEPVPSTLKDLRKFLNPSKTR